MGEEHKKSVHTYRLAQIFWRFTAIFDNGWMGCVPPPQFGPDENNDFLGSDVFLKLPSLDLAGDVEL